MCPEASTLSAYFDGELEGVALKAIESHLADCSDCRVCLEEIEELSENLRNIPAYNLASVAKRSRYHIETRAAMAGTVSLWNRTLSIPAPVAAIAAMIVLVLSLGLFLTNQRNGLAVEIASSRQPSQFDEIIEYLESRQVTQAVTFLLPENTILRVVSEPEFVRAAEYDRVYK